MSVIKKLSEQINLEKLQKDFEKVFEDKLLDGGADIRLATLVPGSAGQYKYKELLEMFGKEVPKGLEEQIDSSTRLMCEIERELDEHFRRMLFADTMLCVYEQETDGDIAITIGTLAG